MLCIKEMTEIGDFYFSQGLCATPPPPLGHGADKKADSDRVKIWQLSFIVPK